MIMRDDCHDLDGANRLPSRVAASIIIIADVCIPSLSLFALVVRHGSIYKLI